MEKIADRYFGGHVETAEESYRDEHERRYLRERIKQGFRLLDENMQHLVIWGLSLSPLDIEPGVLMGEALLHRQDCRITVIDPRAHDVAERVRFLLPSTAGHPTSWISIVISKG